MHQILPHCIEAKTSFARLATALEDRSTSFNLEIAEEIKERFEFMNFAVVQLAKLASEHMDRHAKKLEDMRKGIFEVDLTFPPRTERWFFKTMYHTEALYMHAFRVRDAVRHKSKPIPGLSSFDAPGVRDVRNHLLIHPEGAQIYSRSFLWGPETGPVIRPKRSPSEAGKHEDQGLVHNMIEYFERFTHLAMQATPGAV
jgi:hypothetical protein